MEVAACRWANYCTSSNNTRFQQMLILNVQSQTIHLRRLTVSPSYKQLPPPTTGCIDATGPNSRNQALDFPDSDVMGAYCYRRGGAVQRMSSIFHGFFDTFGVPIICRKMRNIQQTSLGYDCLVLMYMGAIVDCIPGCIQALTCGNFLLRECPGINHSSTRGRRHTAPLQRARCTARGKPDVHGCVEDL